MKKSIATILFTTLFFLGCKTAKNFPQEDVYFLRGEKEIISEEEKNSEGGIAFGSNLNSFSKRAGPTFSNYSFVRDSDGDGIEDWNDPWPDIYGPYVDRDFNGVISSADQYVGSMYYFQRISPKSYYFPSHHYFYSPIIIEKQEKKFEGPRKGNLGTTIPKEEDKIKRNRRNISSSETSRKYFPLNQKMNSSRNYKIHQNMNRSNSFNKSNNSSKPVRRKR